jgi:PAS domain S-box-containing protein
VTPRPNRIDDDTVINNLHEPIFVLGAEYDIRYANERLAEVLSISTDELVGTALADLDGFVTSGFTRLRCAIDDVLDGGRDERRVEIETSHPTSAPVPRHLYAEARITRLDGESATDCVLVVIRDISHRKEMEEQLRQRDEQYRSMFDAHSAPMLLIDPESGRIEDANRAAVDFYGYPADELSQLHIDDINCHSPTEVAHERARAKRQERNHFEFEHRLASGEIRDVEVYSSPVQVGDDHLLFSIVHDITQRKEYEHELQLFREVVRQAGHAVMITDADGVIEYVNPAFESQTGYDSDEARGETPHILNSGKQGEAFYDDLWETVLDGEVWDADLINQRKSGELYYVKHMIAPITDEEEITNFVCIESDITERKLREKRLSELNRILRHNLRNTLTTIIGSAELLADEVSEDGGQHRRISWILDQANDLVSMGEKITHIQRLIEAGTDRVGRCDLATVVEQQLAEFRADYPEATVRVDVDAESASVQIDAQTVETLLTELVDNAVRHNDHDDPQVTITVDDPDVETEQIRLGVVDNGPGIPDQERSAVEIGIEDTLAHGSGIGLSHVHWIVTDCGGEVTITDVEPRGSAVTLSLPRADCDD